MPPRPRAGQGYSRKIIARAESVDRPRQFTDTFRVKIVGKRNGEVILTQTIVTSADGKTRTLTTKGKDAKGQAVETVSVYDKQ